MTATDAFYVRGHGAVPEIDPAAWRLHVHGPVERELELSLATLREAFREREVTATLQCAGNRRAGLIAIRDIPGEAPWGPGATGTATWTGVALADVLALAGPLREAAHVGFDGADLCPEAKPAAALRRLDPARQGVPPRGPARLGDERRAAAARPRRAAARGRARLHRRAQRQVARADRGPLERRGTATSSTSPTGCCPRTGRRARARGCRWPRRAQRRRAVTGRRRDGRRRAGRGARLRVRGRRAPRRAGRRLARRRRDLVAGGAARRPRPWAWRHWRTTVDLAPGEHEIVVRAWDSSAATQPEDEAALWNPKGYVNNARPRVRVHAA